jgi:hydroxymethylbilane synthase
LVEIVTRGDVIVDRPLASVGGKGLFIKEIEEALLDLRVDLAVHSMKDLPSRLPTALMIGAVPERDDPRDALVSPVFRTLEALPRGARVGTSSIRRACQLLSLRPDLQLVSIRGNVETRLRKIESEGLAGAVLAFAGLKRLGLAERATHILEPAQMLPAVGQGALAIEVRKSDERIRGVLEGLNHAPDRVRVDAERAFLDVMDGNCQVPVAALAQVEGSLLQLKALVGSPDGTRILREEGETSLDQAEALGSGVAHALMDRGAGELLGRAS